MNSTIITIVSAIAGIIIGGTGMWWSLRDRISIEIEEKVTTKIAVARLQERVKKLESDVWQIQTRQP